MPHRLSSLLVHCFVFVFVFMILLVCVFGSAGSLLPLGLSSRCRECCVVDAPAVVRRRLVAEVSALVKHRLWGA